MSFSLSLWVKKHHFSISLISHCSHLNFSIFHRIVYLNFLEVCQASLNRYLYSLSGSLHTFISIWLVIGNLFCFFGFSGCSGFYGYALILFIGSCKYFSSLCRFALSGKTRQHSSHLPWAVCHSLQESWEGSAREPESIWVGLLTEYSDVSRSLYPGRIPKGCPQGIAW